MTRLLLSLMGACLLLAGLAAFGLYLREYFGESRLRVVANRGEVHTGMNAADVAALLGEPDEALTQSWQDADGKPWQRKFHVEAQTGWLIHRTRAATVDYQGGTVSEWK